MNTVEAIMLSQLPIAIIGVLLWQEIRMIRADFAMKNGIGHNSNPKNTDEDLVHKPLKEVSPLD